MFGGHTSERNGFITVQEEQPLFHFLSHPYLIRTQRVTHITTVLTSGLEFIFLCVRNRAAVNKNVWRLLFYSFGAHGLHSSPLRLYLCF